jgi:plasmid stabilization system protein ParE
MDPRRPGVRAINDVRPGYFIYHLRLSARGQGKGTVRRPRHLIAFRIEDSGDVLVARVFHERQMLTRYLA